jgi:uncharacterized protein YcaQ
MLGSRQYRAIARTDPVAEITPEAIDALPCSERERAGLKLVIDGLTYRAAAQEAGLASHQDLHRLARRFGLAEPHTKAVVGSLRRLLALSAAELERRLVEAPEEITTKDLSVLTGILADKLFRSEGMAAPEDSTFFDRLAALAEQIRAVGGLRLEVTAPRPPIDVSSSNRAGE